ncbi:tetratricopeptide repeat protein [Methylomonas koyamae]|uniref:tetratricopeptide repeat protein n=1 Tax=Methylomonas koyamae TaxID=702114 RepID=UPI00112AF8BD|nr:tetratricopeptide repeat protein [Methylomonas koyamae]TPQ27365.1 hypothetical protein C2U68_08770 [Methylomonas koyamae]
MTYQVTKYDLARLCNLGAAISVILVLIAALPACSTQSRNVGSTGYVLLSADQRTIIAMPKPQLAKLNLSGECRNTTLTFENEQAKALWPAPGFVMPLQHWGMHYAGTRAGKSQPKCFDQELDVRLWQSAIGTPITGRMSEKDVQEYVRIVESVDSRYAHARQTNHMSQDQRAVDMFLGLAQQGDAKAQFRVAGVYEKQNKYPEAIQWYRQAANQGLSLAQERLGQLYLQGLGVEQNEAEGRKWLNISSQAKPVNQFNSAGVPSRQVVGHIEIPGVQPSSNVTSNGFVNPQPNYDLAREQAQQFQENQQKWAAEEQARAQETERFRQQQNEWSRREMERQEAERQQSQMQNNHF